MITILLFGSLADEAGTEKLSVAWQPSWHTVADVLGALPGLHAQTAQVLATRSRVLYAVNQSLVKASHALRDGDELALMPPVTGG